MITFGDAISFEKTKKDRTLKGKNLLELPTDYCVIDIETTGLDASIDDAIEVAIVKVRNNSIIAKYDSLIYTDNYITSFITNLTGITQEEIDDAPKPEFVWKQVLDFIGNDILIAHNANFDINFIYDELLENDLPALENNFVDTLRLSRLTYKDFENHKLQTLVTNLNINVQPTHRALDDVYATFELYKNIFEDFELEKYLAERKKAQTISVSDFVATEMINNSYIMNNTFVFTGKLEHYTRKEAMQLVINNSGMIGTGVTKKTNYLVMGTYDYYSGIINGKSSKHVKAEKLKEAGQEIAIIPETVFYDMLNQN